MCIPFSLEYKQADIFPKCDTRRRTAAVFPHSGSFYKKYGTAVYAVPFDYLV